MKRKQGFTLIEMMIVGAMFFVLTSAFTFTFFIVFKNLGYQNQRFELKEPAAWALENISQDLRQASSITVGNANRITFNISSYETIDYNRVLNVGIWQLLRTRTLSTIPITTGTAAVAKNVSAFTLEYYNANGTLIPTPVPAGQLDNIRLVRITLSCQSTLLTNTETVTLRTQVRPRNL